MDCSSKDGEPKTTDTTPRRRGNGWSGVVVIILAFAILHMWLGFSKGEMGYVIGGTCLFAIAGILRAAPR